MKNPTQERTNIGTDQKTTVARNQKPSFTAYQRLNVAIERPRFATSQKTEVLKPETANPATPQKAEVIKSETANIATPQKVEVPAPQKTTVILKFPTQFSKHINNIKQIEFEGNKFIDLLNFLDTRFGSIKERLMDEDGEVVKPYLNVFINKKNLHSMEGLNTEIPEGATISLLLSRAGG